MLNEAKNAYIVVRAALESSEGSMARLRVGFDWLTGLKQPIFRNVRLVGSWDRHGRYSHEKRIVAMKKFTAPDGCPAWRADVRLDDAQRG